jgi:hypothetical protein
MDIRTWETRMEVLNSKIVSEETALIELTDRVEMLERKSSTSEESAKYQISIEKLDGKPKYTNETARSVRLAEVLNTDDAHMTLLKSVTEAKRAKRLSEINLSGMLRTFSYLKRLIDLEARN